MEYRIISADDHVVEAADVFDRVPSRLRDRVPHIERRDGYDYWTLDGKVVGKITAKAGVHPSEWGHLRVDGSYDSIRPGSYKPVERVKDYQQDGVDAGVLYPNFLGFAGDPAYWVKDPEARLACIQAYNDWLIEDFCGAAPGRLIGLCLVPSWDVDLAVAEAQRAVKMGHSGVVFGGAMDVFGNPATFDPYWDPLWEAVQDLNVPICFHQMSAALERPTNKGNPPSTRYWKSELSGIIEAQVVWHMCTLAPVVPEVIFCGMLDRFPRLRIFLGEAGVGWIPYVLTMSDYIWERNRYWAEPKLKMRPSEYWRRNFASGFWSEPIHPFLLDYLGPDTLLWEGDYPHSITTWPDSQQHIERSLAGVTDPSVRRSILAGNAMRLFNLE